MTKKSFTSFVAICLLYLSSPSYAIPNIGFAIPSGPLSDPFSVSVTVEDIVDLFAYQFTVNFDPLNVHAILIEEGSFLQTGGSTFFIPGFIDNIAGSISFTGNTLIDQIPGVNGSGELARIAFSPIGQELLAFSFSEVLFLDSNLDDIDGAMVPEPSTFLLLLLALSGFVFQGTRRRSNHENLALHFFRFGNR